MIKISRNIFKELLRNRAVVGYLIFLGLAGWGVFILESYAEKAILSMMQIVLFVLPLMTMVFSTMFYYASQEFILLLLAQPLARKSVIEGVYFGLIAGFSFAYILGICLPMFIFYPTLQSVYLSLTGILLTLIFTSLGILVGVVFDDKTKGMGISLVIWAFFAFVFDGILLVIMYQFSTYPIEKVILILTFLNPIDIGRIFMLMQTDMTAIMGLSTAVFQELLGSARGQVLALGALIIWTLLPLFTATKLFERKDL